MNEKEKWNEWFAGLTDGDGCFYINKKENTISFEVTTHLSDLRMLCHLKDKLKAGSVKFRSNSQSVRYRVKAKHVLIDIMNILNGKIYNKARFLQFQTVSQMLNIKQLYTPVLLDKNNSYLAGLIDSDGTVTISVSHASAEDSQKSGVEGRLTRLINSKIYNQLSLKITSIDKQLLLLIKNSYNFGKIYAEKENLKRKCPNRKYHWTICSYHDFIMLYEYLKKNPLKSVKMHRIRLSLLYFKYKELKYHLSPPESLEFKIWKKFCQSWFKYSF